MGSAAAGPVHARGPGGVTRRELTKAQRVRRASSGGGLRSSSSRIRSRARRSKRGTPLLSTIRASTPSSSRRTSIRATRVVTVAVVAEIGGSQSASAFPYRKREEATVSRAPGAPGARKSSS